MSIEAQQWQAAVAAITGAEQTVISCHLHPDGDALGSALALHRATVYYTVMGAQEERVDAQARLAEAAPQARAFVARQVRLRHAPTLEFVSDDAPARAARIDQLLAELGERPEERE